MKLITVLGSTGSIGTSTLNIIKHNLSDFQVYALTAHTNITLLYQQCLLFSPVLAVVSNSTLAHCLEQKLRATKNNKTTVLYGKDALVTASIAPEVDVVMASIVGISALEPTYAAIELGKIILLANKESLVSAGHIFMSAVQKYAATLIPVDSEHSAIFQCLKSLEKNYDTSPVKKIILTASGGPFRNKELKDLTHITPEDACSHPVWKMGQKISVDSSTMMNKALEIIEAYWLFSMPYDKIDVLLHPESIVHSIVEYCDGVSFAQLGLPDIRTAIMYALYYPNRKNSFFPTLDLTNRSLNFFPLDNKRFSFVSLAFDILKQKKYSSSIILNAANETLVMAFLEKKIKYTQIFRYVTLLLEQLTFPIPGSIEHVIDINQQVVAYTNELIDKCKYEN